jgi:glucan phosphoethanolaminetransferase (alkaline phosphatase superfamily)
VKYVVRFFKTFVFRAEPWAAIGFALFLLIFEQRLFNVKYIETFDLIYDETLDFYLTVEKTALLFALALLLTFIFIGASLVSAQRVRLVYFLIFSVVLLIQYGYQYASDKFMALHDFRTAVSAPGNWLDAIWAYFNPWALLPIGLYGLLLLGVSKTQRFGARLLLIVLTLLYGAYSLIYFYTGWDTLESRLRVYAAGPTISLQALFRMSTNSVLEQLFAYHGTRESLEFQSDSPPQNNIVFVIDESVRGDHLSLNGYSRPTTPYLEQLAQEGVLRSWGIAAAGSTCTYRSVALLLTGITQLPDESYQIKKQPTLFQFARAMNYATYYFEGQGKTPRFSLSQQDFDFVDDWFNQDDFGNDFDTDRRQAAKLAELLAESTGNFVIVFKRGVHFPYNDNYPAEATIYSPVLPGSAIVSADTRRLINSYDNSLAYNIDSFFEELLATERILDNTVILYTSDHGETLGAELYPHCGDTRPEAVVPLLMIAAPDQFEVDEQYRASHHNTFATLLDLMGVPDSERRYTYTPSLLTATSADSVDRKYFYGSLFGFDEYAWLPFDATD